MADILEGFKLNMNGVIAGMLVAGICSYIGVYVVLKRIVFVGASLAQISSAGVALAFMLGLSIPFFRNHPLAVSLLVTLVGSFIFSQHGLSRKVPQESIIGIGYLIASAMTLVFIVKSPKGMDDVKELLDGNIITVTRGDLLVMASVFGVVALMHLIFYRQFLYTSFDPEMARTQGFQTRRWELLFYLTLGLTISFAIQYAGLLSVFAYLVIPAVAGLLASRRMFTAFFVAILCALFSTLTGFALALKIDDLPTSPPIIMVMALLLIPAWLIGKLLQYRTDITSA